MQLWIEVRVCYSSWEREKKDLWCVRRGQSTMTIDGSNVKKTIAWESTQNS